MAFLINEGIDRCFEEGRDKCRTIACCVLNQNYVVGDKTISGKDFWRNLFQFIRKGGDDITKTSGSMRNFGADAYLEFRKKHDDIFGVQSRKFWKGESGVEWTTLFSLNPGVDPILRMQSDSSVVCAFCVCALMIHYRSETCPQGDTPTPWRDRTRASTPKEDKRDWRFFLCGASRDTNNGTDLRTNNGTPAANQRTNLLESHDAIEARAGKFSLNINRYMRYMLSKDEKYNTIFNYGQFVFTDVLAKLLEQSNSRNGYEYIGKVRMYEYIGRVRNKRDPDAIYRDVESHLQYGSLCCRLNLYDGYTESERCAKPEGEPFLNIYHFVTVVGVASEKKTSGTKVTFVIQDSLTPCPFKLLDLDLLLQMESTDALHYIEPEMSIKMPGDLSVFDMKVEDIVTGGGFFSEKSETEPDERDRIKQNLLILLQPDYLPEWARELHDEGECSVIDDDRKRASKISASEDGGIEVGTVDWEEC